MRVSALCRWQISLAGFMPANRFTSTNFPHIRIVASVACYFKTRQTLTFNLPPPNFSLPNYLLHILMKAGHIICSRNILCFGNSLLIASIFTKPQSLHLKLSRYLLIVIIISLALSLYDLAMILFSKEQLSFYVNKLS
jgi:hypothetical protein